MSTEGIILKAVSGGRARDEGQFRRLPKCPQLDLKDLACPSNLPGTLCIGQYQPESVVNSLQNSLLAGNSKSGEGFAVDWLLRQNPSLFRFTCKIRPSLLYLRRRHS